MVNQNEIFSFKTKKRLSDLSERCQKDSRQYLHNTEPTHS